jgi:hypothetical protein
VQLSVYTLVQPPTAGSRQRSTEHTEKLHG